MPQFVLIDHSLTDVGGHHFDNAVNLLRAAEVAGFDAMLATNQAFRDEQQLPGHWRVLKPFPNTVYTPLAAITLSESPATAAIRDAGMGGADPSRKRGRPSFLSYVRDSRMSWRQHRRRRRHIRQFADACRKVFQQMALLPGDQVFLTTVNELDLQGLARSLRANPATRAVHWHLQFHFPFLSGRQPDWEGQSARRECVRRGFLRAQQGLHSHQLHFYTTTRELTEQYESLAVGRFPALPYPLQPELQQPDPAKVEPRPPDSYPLRLLSAGGIRAEKGQHELQTLLDDLWDDCLASGKLQLQVQAGSSPPVLSWPDDPSRDEGPGGVAGSRRLRVVGGKGEFTAGQQRREPCVFVPHPLPAPQYARLIREADIGLLLYDAATYYARRAGVLGEMLCSGVPVVVPAGCWLAEQIAESVYGHLDDIASRIPMEPLQESWAWRGARSSKSSNSAARAPSPDSSSLDSRVSDGPAWDGPSLENPYDEAAWRFGGQAGPLTLEGAVAGGIGQLLLTFRRGTEAPRGTFVRLTCHQLDGGGQSIASSTEILGMRAADAPLPVLIHVQPGVQRIRFEWQDAYHDLELALHDPRLRMIPGGRTSDDRLPLGAVGLIAATPREASRLVREIVARYPHYRKTATDHARRQAPQHEPGLALQGLLHQASGRPWRVADAA